MYSEIRISRYMSDTFPLKNSLKEEALFTIAFELFLGICHLESPSKSRNGLNGMVHTSFQFTLIMLIHWVKAYVLQRKTETLLAAGKESGLRSKC
jgi:hypothetical protein